MLKEDLMSAKVATENKQTTKQFSSVQFMMVFLHSKNKTKQKQTNKTKNMHAPHLVSQKCPQRSLWNGSTVRLINYGPLSSFQSPWYNRIGWLGIKQQLTYLFALSRKIV